MVREVNSVGNALDISASPMIPRKREKEPEKDLDKVGNWCTSITFGMVFGVYNVYLNSFAVLANIHTQSTTKKSYKSYFS